MLIVKLVLLIFQTCKQLNVLASSSLNIGFAKADRLHGVIQREVLLVSCVLILFYKTMSYTFLYFYIHTLMK